jgi:hypothetical protein
MDIDDPEIQKEYRRILDKQRARYDSVYKFESLLDLQEGALLPVGGIEKGRQNMIKTPPLTNQEKRFLRDYTVKKRLKSLKAKPAPRKGPSLADYMKVAHIVGGRRTKKRVPVRKNTKKRRS